MESQNTDVKQPMRIAVVGMSCRLSGDVSSLDDFWQMLARARCGWSEVPEKRFSKDAYHHPNPAKMGAFNTVGGYFIDQDPAMFDAPFFNITQAEAEAMDPQQRLLLECAYEAIENAGIPKEKLIGRKVGVFVGGAASDYRLGTLRDLEQTPMFDATGNHQSIMSGRISHYFDLRGPCFTVDTACSSSIYALHQAVQSIRNGESEQAIVASCHLNLQPADWVSMSLSRLFSDEGKTFAFDHRANSGFARGEGAGALILKPLDQAIRDNDRICSVIVNTGGNQDGRTVGITSPSGRAQEQLMREVYASAGISPDDAGFVEAHGTGTKVGDPIEAQAIRNVFGHGRTLQNPLYVGSVKSNVGHLENASGVISIIKASLMLERRFILPNTNFEKPNPNIPFHEWNGKVPTMQRPWPTDKRFISVNNFGFGGSNAHCVLERAPPPKQRPENAAKGSGLTRQRLIVLSANDETAARNSMSQLNVYLEQHPEVFQKTLMRNLAYTLTKRRSQLAWRVGMVSTSGAELVEILSSAETKPVRVPLQAPRIGFVYTGQGAQWYAMGRELLESHPVFAATIHAADDCLKRIGADFSLLEELMRDKDSTQVGKAHISQPICTAIQLGLTDLLRSWGVTPSAVTGHSSGEICAAYAAGALSLEAAIIIAYQRGQVVIRLKQRHPDLNGTMMAVGAGPEEMKPVAASVKSGVVVVACENSPSSITASGDEAAIDELAAIVEAKQMFNRKLRVDVAYHSPHMKLVADDYMETIQDVATPPTASDKNVRFFSSLHGKEVGLEKLGAQYWVDNLTCPVRFSTALSALCTECPPDVIIEIGPHAALAGPIKQTIKALNQPAANKIQYFSALSRGKNATTTALEMAAGLFMRGYALDFDQINGEDQATVTDGPPMMLADMSPYPWSRQKYWNESRMSQQHRHKPFPRHDLLGNLADFSNHDLMPTWRNVLRTSDLPWLRDHKMQSLTTFPFAGYVTMAIEAAAQRAALRKTADTIGEFRLREIGVNRPLLMEDGTDYEVVLSMWPYAEGTRSYSDDWDEFRICSWQPAQGWTEHARGLIGTRKASAQNNPVSSAHHGIAARAFQRADAAAREPVDVAEFYRELDTKGATYGPIFRKLHDIRATENYSAAAVDVADTIATMPMEHESAYHIHPSLLDQIFQLSFPILGAGRTGMSTLYMPSAIRELNIQKRAPTKPGETLYIVGEGKPDLVTPKATDFHMTAMHNRGDQKPVISLVGLQMVPVKSESASTDAPRELCYKLQWEPVDGTVEASSSSSDAGKSEFAPSFSLTPSDCSSGSGSRSPLERTTRANSHENLSVVGSLVSNITPLSSQIDIKIWPESKTKTAIESIEEIPPPTWTDMTVAVISDMPATDTVMATLVESLAAKTGKTPVVCPLAEASSLENMHFVVCELEKPLLASLTPDRFARLQKMATASAGLLWVTRGAYLNATNPTGSMALGLTRTLRSEMAAKVATIDLDPHSSLVDGRQAELVLKAFARIFRPASEWKDSSVSDNGESDVEDMEFAEKDGHLVVPRIVNDEATNLVVHRALYESAPYAQDFASPGRRLKFAIGTTGALDTIYFKDEPLETLPALGYSEVEIRLEATGMNFKDVVIAMGQLPSPYLGIECAGVVSSVGAGVTSLAPGDRVCAMTEGAYGTFARCPATSAAKIPANMSFEVAATIPVVYCTAYYGLIELGRMTAGERVLIHAAAGGVGQAAIQLAQLWGAEVFATVGSVEKKKFLQERYRIPEDHIFSSRDISFGPALREATDGAGVDVVINSLAGDMLRETWDCLSHFGRFVEIGKRDITSNTRLEMGRFNWNASFHSVDLTVLAMERPRRMAQTFSAVMQLFSADSVKPIGPITVYGVSEIETAFRLLQSGKTTGKLVVVPRPGEQVRATHRSEKSTNLFRSDATYVIVGGTGGLGRSMTHWMVGKGARNIVLLSRGGRAQGPVAELINDLTKSAGANIVVRPCDVANAGSVASVVEYCSQQLPPIAGVVHASMVLRDVLFEKMSFEDYEAVIRSKVSGAWNLHKALATTPLDFFIVISSAAGVVGNRGQAAYAAANTFLDAFARFRTQQGMPTTALDLTAVADVGYLADNAARQEEVLKNLGGETICEAEILALLHAAVKGTLQQTCASHCMTGLKLGGEDTTADQLPYFASDAKFTHMRDAVLAASAASGSGSAADVSIAVALARAASPKEAVQIVTTGLAGKLGGILMVPADELDPETPITKYGLDSLNAIELRNWITKELSTNLQVLELLTSGSLTNLANNILKKRAAAAEKA